MKTLLAILVIALTAVAHTGECQGATPCKACKDCSKCAHCSPKNPQGGFCSVIREQTAAQAQKRLRKL